MSTDTDLRRIELASISRSALVGMVLSLESRVEDYAKAAEIWQIKHGEATAKVRKVENHEQRFAKAIVQTLEAFGHLPLLDLEDLESKATAAYDQIEAIIDGIMKATSA